MLFYYNIMRIFTEIFSMNYPDIDIMRSAFEHPSNRNSMINQDFVAYAFINALHHCDILTDSLFSKFNLLKQSIISNTRISDDKREEVINNFSKSQKCYLGLCRFARLWKVKHARVSPNDCDLYMNPLDNIKKHL